MAKTKTETEPSIGQSDNECNSKSIKSRKEEIPNRYLRSCLNYTHTKLIIIA